MSRAYLVGSITALAQGLVVMTSCYSNLAVDTDMRLVLLSRLKSVLKSLVPRLSEIISRLARLLRLMSFSVDLLASAES